MHAQRFMSLVVVLVGWSMGVAHAANGAASTAPATSARSQPAGLTLDTVKIDDYMRERIEADKFPSLAIGVVYDQALIFCRAYGVADRKATRPATTETLYRIGSISKVFTTTLMCILRDKGVVRLDDPVSKYLPADVKLPSDPRGAPAITLRHLATHTSGLPKLPPNVASKGEDAYGGYTVAQLYAGLADTPMIFPTGAKSVYSNLGVALLGHALERAAGQPYEALLKKNLLEPLGMKDTTVALSARQRERFSTPYNGEGLEHETADWDLGCLAPCGGLASTVPDLAKFVSLQLRAGKAGVTPVSGATLLEMQTPQRLTQGWKAAMGLGWQILPYDEETGDLVWHNGGTGGHFAFIGFTPSRKIGVIVLTNACKEIDSLGMWLLKLVLAAAQQTGPATQPVPTAEQVLDRYIEVTGGAKAYEAVHTMVVHYKGNLGGMPVTDEEYTTDSGRYYSIVNMGLLGSSQEGSDGQTVWETSSIGSRIVTGRKREADLRDANPTRDLRWRDLYKYTECKKVVDYEGVPCYDVLLISPDDLVEDRYYDVETGLMIGRKSMVDDASFGLIGMEEVYGDYSRYGNLLLPASRTMKIMAQEMALKIQSVEINGQVPDSRFDLPSAIKALRDKRAASQPASKAAND